MNAPKAITARQECDIPSHVILAASIGRHILVNNRCRYRLDLKLRCFILIVIATDRLNMVLTSSVGPLLHHLTTILLTEAAMTCKQQQTILN